MSPGQLDVEVVRRHLRALDAAVQNLGHHRARPLEALRGDLDELWTVLHGLQLCAQNTLDIARHVAASAGKDVPDYAGAIDELAVLGLVPRDFASRFRAVAGFRNVLVRGYLDVDVERVHEVLNEGLDDFIEFAEHVHRYLDPTDAPDVR